MANLIVMVGLPGSGKSTYADELKLIFEKFGDQCVILSSDAYREKILGNENDQSNNEKVFQTLYNDMRTWLSRGYCVIIDATNTTLKARRRIFYELKASKKYVSKSLAYVINTPIEVCIENDKKRDRYVGEEVIHKFENSFQFPQKFEGFDDIIIKHFKHANDDKCFPEFDNYHVFLLRNKMMVFNQNNPHHIYTLGKHCEELASNYIKDRDWIAYSAGLWHDVGKLFTQHYDENGVAHYFNHDSVGAYFLASHLELIADPCFTKLSELYEIIFYVNYHMKAHKDLLNPKAKRKYTQLFGENLYNKLIQFAEYDKIASGTYDIHNKLVEEEKYEIRR